MAERMNIFCVKRHSINKIVKLSERILM